MRLDKLAHATNIGLLAGAVCLTACDDDDDDVDAEAFARSDLVSNVEGLARTTDPNLVDPWGVAAGPDTFLWVANRGSGTASVYDGEGNIVFLEQVDGDDVAGQLVVAVPPPPGVAPGTRSRPTAIVHNRTGGFEVPIGDDDEDSEFLFATETGTISGWAEELEFEAALLLDTAGRAAYTGLASRGGTFRDERLYAADFLGGVIDVFEADLEPEDDLDRDPFFDPAIPEDLFPFSIAHIDGDIYIGYARPAAGRIVPEIGAGLGAISRFEADGELVDTLVIGEPLNAPVAIVESPDDFGPFDDDEILVANMGDGRILAFDEDDGRFLGDVTDEQGAPIVIQGLRGLQVGNDDDAGEEDQLFFTASLEGGDGGLLGRIEPIER